METAYVHPSNHPVTFNVEFVSTAMELSAYSFQTLTLATPNSCQLFKFKLYPL